MKQNGNTNLLQKQCNKKIVSILFLSLLSSILPQDSFQFSSPSPTIYLLSPSFYYFKDIKKDVVQLAGIRLVVVPCWWDGSINRYFSLFLPFLFLKFALSLSTTIGFQCPDVALNTSANPIALNPPCDFFQCMLRI
jgi:hypothetical protein